MRRRFSRQALTIGRPLGPSIGRPIELLTTLLIPLLSGCSEPPPPAPEAARVAVTTEIVVARPFRAHLDLFGRVEPSSRTPVQAPVGGRLAYAKRFAGGLRTGEWVEEGTPLFELRDYNTELRLVEARLQRAAQLKELDLVRRSVEAGIEGAVELERAQVVAELAYERLANAERRKRELSVLAPVSGHLVVERAFAPSTVVAPGQVIAEIAGAGAPRIEAKAASSDLPSLRVGLPVEVFSASGQLLLGRGRLVEVSHQIDVLGTVRLAARVGDDLEMPAPGEGVLLRVLVGERAEALSVPTASLLVEGGVAFVFVLEPSGEARRANQRVVQLGGRDQERVEVIAGLTVGEWVAVRGVDLLSDGVLAVDTSDRHTDGRIE